MDCDVAVFFNEKEGVLVLEGDDWAEVTLTIGGIAYPVTSPEIDLKKLGLRDGEYAVEITYDGEDGVTSLGGGCFQTTKDEYWGAITFFDEDKRLICRYFIEEGYRLKEEDFPEFPIREGVTYEWDCQIAVGEEVPGNLDVGLRLTYTEYTVTYQKNGGNFFSVNYPTKYTAEAQRKLPALQKDGYLFAGWYPSADFSGARIYEVGGPYIYGNLTLYAKFEPLSADLQVLFSAIATTMSAEKVTIKGDGSEMGYDFSNGDFYAYEKYSGKLMYVISGGKYYDFNEKISYPYERESNIAEALGLEEVLSYCAEIRYDGETNGVRNYSFMSRHGEKILTFGVKDNKIVSASFVDGYTVNLSVTYDCQKQSVNESEFTSVKKVRVQRLTGLENENWTEEIVFKANENVEDNQRIQNMMQTLGGEWQFKGFYSDESCTQKVNSYADLGTNLYLLFINPQTLIRETEIVLRLTCHCPECEGKMTEYRTTLNELYELGNKSGETQDHLTKIAFGDFYDVGDGYVMEGLYVSYGQYDELFN